MGAKSERARPSDSLISEGSKLLSYLNHHKYYYGSCIGYVFVCENTCTHVCVCMWRLGGQCKKCLLHWPSRQGLSVNLELTNVATFEDQ